MESINICESTNQLVNFNPDEIFSQILKKKKNRLEIENIVKSSDINLNAVNDSGKSLMSLMVENNLHFGRLIEIAIEKETNFLMQLSYGNRMTIAHAIFQAGDIESTRVLTSYLKDKNYLFQFHGSFLHFLVHLNLPNVIKELEDLQIDHLDSSLLLAIRRDNLTIIKLLLDKGANANARDRNGNSLLYLAANNPEILKLLLDKGANVDDTNREGCSVLHAVNNPESLELLLQFKPDVNIRNKVGITPLISMCSWSQSSASVMNLLLMEGADLLAFDIWNYTALSHLIDNRLSGNEHAVEVIYMHILVKTAKGVRLDCPSVKNFTLIFLSQPKWRTFVDEMVKGIQLMKTINLGDTATTLWDIAKGSIDEVSTLFSNWKLMKAALDCQIVTCKILDDMVKKKMELGHKRRMFAIRCLPILEKTLQLPLPHPCLEGILRHLDMKTLQKHFKHYSELNGIPISVCAMFEHTGLDNI